MLKEYIWYQPDGDVGGIGDLDALMKVARERVAAGRPYNLTVDGQAVFKKSKRRRDTLNQLEQMVSHAEVGHTFRVKPDLKPVVFKVRVVEPVLPPVAPINGNDKSNAFWQALNAEFSDTIDHFAGCYVCKPDSQHRFGNAVDTFFKTFAEQEKAAAWAVANADRLHIEHVISGDRIWTRGVGWHAYTGEYHAHLHVDFAPNFPTYWSCGVRG